MFMHALRFMFGPFSPKLQADSCKESLVEIFPQAILNPARSKSARLTNIRSREKSVVEIFPQPIFNLEERDAASGKPGPLVRCIKHSEIRWRSAC
jgi:hypothetical protein